MNYEGNFLAFLISSKPCFMPIMDPATTDKASIATETLRMAKNPSKSVTINKTTPTAVIAIQQPIKAYLIKIVISAPFCLFYHKVTPNVQK